MANPKIVVVEDDESLGATLKSFLRDEGYDVTLCPNIAAARAENLDDYGLMILDWMLPDGQGIDYLRELRGAGNKIQVIMLTARTEVIDKVVGLESGADDYLTKPFEPRELAARIRVQIRHQSERGAPLDGEDVKINLGDIVIDRERREVSYKGTVTEFTKMEYEFLVLLAESPNRAFSREEILNKVWGYENYPSTRTVDTHVLQIRQKLYDGLIETVRGVGYRLRFES
ncbi:MAG: response regulator transcription factor [Bdellovibrionota bacterium]|jgi:DNA-binding response OmpR family regulator|nr:response regulator transcription factor [Bdellovibrionota bacterium]